MITLRNLNKHVFSGEGERLDILGPISLHIPKGQFVAIRGPSGSGKSTLLGLLAGLDKPSGGEVWVEGVCITHLDEDASAGFRGKRMGFVFQAFHLIANLTAAENVQAPLEIAGDKQAERKAQDLLVRVDLANRAGHYPAQLSGGEQQRVAIARAFARSPSVLLADEPTGNLDSTNGQKIVQLLQELHQQHGVTLVLVTHDPAATKAAQRMVQLHDGQLREDSAPEALPKQATA